MLNLYKETRAIAQEAIEQAGTDRDARDVFIWNTCEYHECAIYYHKAIQFCAEQNTTAGEEFLDECGGSCAGDTFGSIACKIAFGTLYQAAIERLDELLEEKETV